MSSCNKIAYFSENNELILIEIGKYDHRMEPGSNLVKRGLVGYTFRSCFMYSNYTINRFFLEVHSKYRCLSLY